MHDDSVSIRNDRFDVSITADRRMLTLTDTDTSTVWATGEPFLRLRKPSGPPDRETECWFWGFPDPTTQVPWTAEQLDVTTGDGRAMISLSGVPSKTGTARVECSISLERDRVIFAVEGVDGLARGEEVIVDFPWRLGASKPGDEGWLIIPRGAGVMADFDTGRTGRIIENFIYSGGQNGYSMPIFGVTKGEHTLGTMVKTPYDCLLHGEINAGEPAAYAMSPCWLFEGGRLMDERRADYTVFRGDYNELAAWYREELIREGRYRTLREKAEDHPEVEKLPGAVLAEMGLDFIGTRKGRRSPYELADTADAMGFDCVVAYSVGIWQRPFWGTEAVPPDQGTKADLERAVKYAREKNPGYWITVYENLVDMWPDTPGYDERIMSKLRDGSIRPNWMDEKKGLRSSTVCSVHRLETAKRDLPDLRKILGRGSIYIDVEGAIELIECFDPEHPLTRQQDAEQRRELLTFVKDLFGTVATESMPIDCLADVVDVGAYFPVYQWAGYGASDFPRIEPAVIPIPLFGLVYHGSVLSMTPKENTFYTCDRLYVPLWDMMPDETDEFCVEISKTLRETNWATMTEHRFLSTPRVEISTPKVAAGKEFHAADVQMTRFSDGTQVVVNFSGEPFMWDGKEYGAGEWVVERG